MFKQYVSDLLHRRCHPRQTVRRGFIFLFALVALVVMLVLGVLSMQLATDSIRHASQERDLAAALHLAEAGADAAEAFLRKQSYPPTDTITYPGDGDVLQFDTGTSQATISPVYIDDTVKVIKHYMVVATGTTPSGATRTVIVQLRQQNFALYAYFTDEEISPLTNDTIWFYSKDRVYGPVHSNDELHVDWDKTSADPIFYGSVSSAHGSVDWGNGGTPKSTNDWRRVLDGGQPALTLNVDRIELPESSDGVRNNAWGAEYGFPSTNGVYVPNDGADVTAGIYLRGDSQITFSVENTTGNQVITIKQGTKTTTITVDLKNNQTKVKPPTGSTKTYTGVPNGAIYCTGHVTGLSGTLADNYENGSVTLRRNAYTIATDMLAGKDIVITNTLKYQTEPDATKPANHQKNLRAATLGLVAEDVKISSSCPNEMTIDAVILAGAHDSERGTFWYEDWSGTKRNNLNLLGGVIQKQRGPVGQFNAASNKHTAGYNKNYKYDTRMGATPPPFFPTTGKYDVVSWQYR